MGRCLSLCALLMASALVVGCSAGKNVQSTAAGGSGKHAYEVVLNENDPASGHKLVKKAHSAIGTPYVLGGSKPGGFDCSGLVKWTYDSIGVDLPRTAREQSLIGAKVKEIDDMRAGDIVAFKHPKRGYHTGIYIGDGKFIHSPRKRSHVRINCLDEPYFRSTLLGARRIDLNNSSNLVAEAKSRIAELAAQEKSVSTMAKATTKKRGVTKKSSVTSSKKGNSAKTVASSSKGNAKKKSSSKITTAKIRQKSKNIAQNPVKSAKQTAARKSAPKSVSLANSKAAKSGSKTRNHS